MTVVDDLYGLLGQVERRCGGARRLAECAAGSGWPKRGVYFFFEDGEYRRDGVSPRVVRVGTHGLRPSKSTLWNRLSQHRGSLGGGGGNHRGSIFRLHVGGSLIASGRFDRCVPLSWGKGSTASGEVRDGEYELERAVTHYIGAMPFVWLAVDDEPGSGSDRGVVERGAIAILSNQLNPADPPSSGWLGRHSNREAVRHSGLWNVNHTADVPDERIMAVIDRWLR